MKKRTLIVIVVLIVVALIAAACVYGYVSGRQQTQEEPPVSEPEKPAEPEGPDTPDKPDEEPVQPDNPNPSGGESVIVYVPDEQGETLTPVGADAKDDSDQALVDALIAELRKMNKELNIPYAIQNYGEGGVIAEQSIIDEKEFNEKLSEVAKNAIADACTGSNPRIPTQEEMEKLLTAVYYDKEIDF